MCQQEEGGGKGGRKPYFMVGFALGAERKTSKKFLTSMCSLFYIFFCNPTPHETKSGIANRWENTNRKPHMDQSL